MFFGASKNKKGKSESVLEKYNPWYANQYSGELSYKLDNSNKYTIYREFKKSKCKIIDERLNDISKDFSIDKNKGNQFFYEQTNIDEDTLLNTAVSRQEEIKLDEKEQKNLTVSLTNLAQTGEENISYIKAIDKLDKKLKDEVGTDRTVGKPINIIESKLSEYKNTIEDLKYKKDKITQIYSEIELNKKKQEKLKNKVELNNKVNSFKQKQKIIKDLKQEKESKNNTNSINKLIWVLIIMFVVLCVVIGENTIKIISAGSSIVLLIVYFFNKVKIKKYNKDKIKQDSQNMQKEIDEIYNEFSEKVTYSGEIDNLLSCELEEVTKIMNEENKLYNDIILENNRLTYEKERLNSDIEQYSNIYEKLQLLEKEKVQIKLLEDAIKMAKEELENSYLQMKNQVIPSIIYKLSDIAKEITNGKYNKVSFSDEKGLIVSMDNGDICEVNKLSVGTIYQLYLALRITLINKISNSDEKVPIIIDEAFSYFDNERLKSTLTFLNNFSKDNQVLIFTCNNKEEDILDKEGIEYNLINI